MSDQQMAALGRQLALALTKFKRDRRDEDREEALGMLTELCRAYRIEKEGDQPIDGPEPP